MAQSPKRRDGAIIDLNGVAPSSTELLLWGAAVDIDRLLALPKLKTLNIYKLRSKELDRVKRLNELPLENLSLRFWPEPDLTAMALPASLKHLTVWQSNKFVALDGIETAGNLESLSLSDNGPLQGVKPLKALPRLTAIAISGGIWTSQKTPSLDGLADLEGLTHLHLQGIDGRHVDLSPVAQIPNLTSLDLWARDFPLAEVAKVAAAFPFFHKDLLDLDDYPLRDSYGVCDTCGSNRKQMFIKGGKFLWCPVCDQKGLERQIAKFETAVEQARHALNA